MSKTISCIIVDDEPIAREILENHLQKIAIINIVATCKNAIEAFNAINSNKVDVIFLDINMPEISGLSFAKSINKDFLRIHRSFIISINKIESFTNESVDINKKAIPISRSYKEDVLLRLENV